ncbi:hypothetical protein GCM10007380_09120 [Gottfriedia solisilvae]|uniref:Uncharacterized protein n=1 Tax=Gottfriedia solisilvae TaxID=1516104 RepID=A0A8J3AF07_9BACI|nr:hypothetical protein GCM10007380_09120 [Gottfriedia solisilvae]
MSIYKFSLVLILIVLFIIFYWFLRRMLNISDRYFTGIDLIMAGLGLLLLLGYLNMFRKIFEGFGFPTNDIFEARYSGFSFICFGLVYILIKSLRKKRKS